MTTSRWGLILAGIFDILFGIALVAFPKFAIGVILIIFGFYAIFFGAALLAGSAYSRSGGHSVWLAIGGIVSILAGVLAFFYRTATVVLLVFFFGFRALLLGGSEIIAAFRKEAGAGADILVGLLGVLNVLFGFFLIFFPLAGAATVILIIGWYSIIIGIILLARGLFSKRLKMT